MARNQGERVSIGRVKRDISESVTRVAFGGERIVLTSRGNPKAALVSLEDLERIEKTAIEWQRREIRLVKEQNDGLVAAMRVCNGGPLDMDAIQEADRRELEARDGRSPGH